MDGIAIIGLSGRFPGADDIKTFWQNLKDGVTTTPSASGNALHHTHTDRAGSDSSLHGDPLETTLNRPEHFDAAFFGISPEEARVLDPQHRLFLECSWEALEDSGYEPASYAGTIGVFAGSYTQESTQIASRVSYHLNLKGPSISIQTDCSTSLIAVVQACMGLVNGQCDMALAGAARLSPPYAKGYANHPKESESPDGICRAFDARAEGTVYSDGVATVLLKRLEDALEDSDKIYAVIKGWGLNSNGAATGSHTSPDTTGQRDAISMAHKQAHIDPRTISYIETHGTGNPHRDATEIKALTQAFRQATSDRAFCAIGSIKTNIGHLDLASGVAGLIKTALALDSGVIPPSLHFEAPNPDINFEDTPFFVNTELIPWPGEKDTPRRAGISSFGLSGTNVHVLLEDAPSPETKPSPRSHHLIVLSARSQAALDAIQMRLLDFMQEMPDVTLEDIAYTLQSGRASFNYKRYVVIESKEALIEAFKSEDTSRIPTYFNPSRRQPLAFMFPGQGSQHVNMGRHLYENEPIFRREFDICAHILEPTLGVDIRTILYPKPEFFQEARSQINQTSIAQPGVFVVSYALAKFWIALGLQPDVMIGHSVGEFVAATLAGVFSIEDALQIVALRSTWIDKLPQGSMLAIRMPASSVTPYLGDNLSIAAVNSPGLTIVSGPASHLRDLQQKLTEEDIICRPLQTSHAHHSSMMEPLIQPLENAIKSLHLKTPSIPIISTVTAEQLTPDLAKDPSYWARHLCETVQFAPAIGSLLAKEGGVFLEVGPGQALTTLTRQHPATKTTHAVFPSLPHARQEISSYYTSLDAVGKLWQLGISFDWKHMYQNEHRLRIHLPTYPFERHHYRYDGVQLSLHATGSYGRDQHGQANVMTKINGIVSSNPSKHDDDTMSLQPPAPDPLKLIDYQLKLMTQQLHTWHRLLTSQTSSDT